MTVGNFGNWRNIGLRNLEAQLKVGLDCLDEPPSQLDNMCPIVRVCPLSILVTDIGSYNHIAPVISADYRPVILFPSKCIHCPRTGFPYTLKYRHNSARAFL